MTCAPISRAVCLQRRARVGDDHEAPADVGEPGVANACQYARRCESVSTVEPDLLETTTTVRSSRSASAARTWCGSVVSSTVSGDAEGAGDDLGGQRGAAHAGQHDVVEVAELPSSARPARAAAPGCAGRCRPSRAGSPPRPRPRGPTGSGPSRRAGPARSRRRGSVRAAERAGHRVSAAHGKPGRGLAPHAHAVLAYLRQLGLHALEQLEPGGLELLHALALEGRGHVVVGRCRAPPAASSTSWACA